MNSVNVISQCFKQGSKNPETVNAKSSLQHTDTEKASLSLFQLQWINSNSLKTVPASSYLKYSLLVFSACSCVCVFFYNDI